MSKTKLLFAITTISVLYNCVKDRNFDAPEDNTASDLVVTSTYNEIKNLYVDKTFQIQKDLVIEGYVVSSDKAGNFFSTLYFQDSPVSPTEGFQIEIDLRDSHLFYSVGSKIHIKLKGLYLGKTKEVFKIGGVFTSFGNISVGRLPATVVDRHIFVASDEKATMQPTRVGIDQLRKSLTNTLVQINDVEIFDDELGEPFALDREETERTLIDCNKNKIDLINSGFSDFRAALLPNGHGSITGILQRKKERYSIVIRDREDIDFKQQRCENIVNEVSSDSVFISELADPNNNARARFVELYNSSGSTLNLNGWKLYRYTNANTEVSSEIDLSGMVLNSKEALVISPNATEFEAVYGFAPDIGTGTNSPADSNGDDNLELVDSFGKIIDVFGVIGEDGSGTNHEFEDGRAVRNVKVKKANTVYTFSEWRIFNDSGAASTTNRPQNAPEDFTPGIHN
ncbi:extracellular nuclease [hydrothermal vent metagenome]|uniref:Extracellular nuclease n=1 Tax=hydrothermal vent metagenome TaxID=652676 RepID=A0A3B0TH18_9ZZZZ